MEAPQPLPCPKEIRSAKSDSIQLNCQSSMSCLVTAIKSGDVEAVGAALDRSADLVTVRYLVNTVIGAALSLPVAELLLRRAAAMRASCKCEAESAALCLDDTAMRAGSGRMAAAMRACAAAIRAARPLRDECGECMYDDLILAGLGTAE